MPGVEIKKNNWLLILIGDNKSPNAIMEWRRWPSPLQQNCKPSNVSKVSSSISFWICRCKKGNQKWWEAGSSRCGLANPPAPMRTWVWTLALHSGLSIWCCHELQCRLQTWLTSGISVAVAVTPSLGTSTCHGCSPKRDEKRKKKERKKEKKMMRSWNPVKMYFELETSICKVCVFLVHAWQLMTVDERLVVFWKMLPVSGSFKARKA